MKSTAKTVTEYINSLPEERKKAITLLRKTILDNLPKGFKEEMNYGMIGYVVPHSIYPEGYHCNPSLPLPFMNIALQKNFIALYHMGIYADKDLLKWFKENYNKHSDKKLDMGKSCLRFKNPDDIPYKFIGQLVKKMSPKQWIQVYKNVFKK